MRWRVALICLVMGIFSPSFAHAQSSLQDRYLHIYLEMNEAYHYESTGDVKSALDDFKDCYSKLVSIHDSDPDWEAALVLQRMKDCKSAIQRLQPKVDSLPTNPSPATPTNSTNLPATPAPTTDTSTPSSANGDLQAMETKLAGVEQELKITKGALEDMTAKYQNKVIEAQTFKDQLDSVNQQLAALKSQQTVDDRVAKLMSDNQALTDKLTAAEAEVKSLNPGNNPKSSMSMLRMQLKNAQDKLQESEAANTALQQTTTTLQQQLTQAQTDLNAANQKLASAGVGSPEYTALKREDEVMRAILQREIREQSRRDGAKRLAQEEFDRLKITSKIMQEQLDILASPMTPPTTDEERALLDGLKTASPDIADAPAPTPSGNVLSAPQSSAPTMTDTNSTTATPPATAPSADTNQPPATVAMTPSTDTNSTTAATPNPPAMDTNSTAAVTPPAPTPDTNMAAATPLETPAPPATNDATASTQMPPPPSTPAAADTNAAPATSPDNSQPAAAAPPSNPPTNDSASTAANDDPSKYASKPRLPDDMRDTAQQAADLFKNQRYDEAAAKYQTIIDKYPESLYAWSNLGIVRFQQNNLPEAMKALQQAVKISPSDAFAYSNLGVVYYQMQQYENAIDALNHAIALNPNDAKSHNYLGCACSQKGWEQVAEEHFRKAIEIDDNFGEAHFNLALVYAMQKPPSLELARRHYNQALALGMTKDARLEKLLQQ